MKIVVEAANLEELKTLLEQLSPASQGAKNHHIKDLQLSTRTKNVLLSSDFETIEQLATMSQDELVEVPNLGRAGVAEVRGALMERGLLHLPKRKTPKAKTSIALIKDHVGGTFDELASLKEGWNLWSFEKRLRIQRLDDPQKVKGLDYTEPKFESDAEAISFVVQKASEGSWHHRNALSLVGREVD